MSKRAGSLRDELITKAQYGKITPDEAEARAKAAGLPPFATQPEFSDVDPMTESRWTMVMAIAWIAWRDLQLVAEQRAEFRDHCWYWVWRERNEPIQSGERFLRREGWSLETRERATLLSLSLEDACLRSHNKLPSSAKLTPRQAERQLWQALSDERLLGEGFNNNGGLVEIPAREWAHLKPFEAGNRQVLRFHALDRGTCYSEVRFRRNDLVSLWPADTCVDSDSSELGLIGDVHIEPMKTNESHVPLSTAICWIVTRGGIAAVPVSDEEAWKVGVRKLRPMISDGRVEIIGRDKEQVSLPLTPALFASVQVPPPVHLAVEYMLAEAPTHIRCSLFTGEADWERGFNDKFFAARDAHPRWTHLQVRREHVLKSWPKPDSTSRTEADCRQWLIEAMRESPDRRPKAKAQFLKEAQRKFKPLAARRFHQAWDDAIKESGAVAWLRAGAPRKKSNHRIN